MIVSVIGSGSWGTALSNLLGEKGYDVHLFARDANVAAYINDNHKNPRYLANERLSTRIVASSDIATCLADTSAVVIVTPSMCMRDTATMLKGRIPDECPVVLCSKGVEGETGLMGHEVFTEVLGNPQRFAVLSGPNHAEEVIQGIPAAATIASVNSDIASFFQTLFATSSFRTYTSEDILGVELCAAFKNVIAIAVGISYGLGYGDNTAATLITRGLAEMSRLVSAAGGNPLTCLGLAGTGDLIATCMSHHSRNRHLGEMVSQGKTLDDFTSETHMVAEGAFACRTLFAVSEKIGVDLPIASLVRRIVWEGLDPSNAAQLFADRPLKSELYGISSNI